MLVLRTSNFQGATIRPIIPRHKHSIVFIVLPSSAGQLKNSQNPLSADQSNIYSCAYRLSQMSIIRSVHWLKNSVQLTTVFSADDYYPSGYFPRTGTMG